MAKTYRALTGAGLQPFAPCPSCGGPTPTFNSYEVVVCQDRSVTLYIDETVAFSGGTQIINNASYSTGQVLWATAGAGNPRFCVEIVNTDVDQEPTLYFDVISGPWSVCNQCINPDQDPT